MNLFVGGYLQSWSAGRWPSLLHSGSNPSEDNLEGVRESLGGNAGGVHAKKFQL